MKLTGETKFFVGIIGFTLLIVIAAVFFYSQPPKPLLRTDLVTPTAQTLGPKNASHYLVEFSDFQCPACKAFSITVDELAIKYTNKLLIVYRNYPLPQHPESRIAAAVAAAAGEQGKFWEMSKLLFAHQDILSDSEYATLAGQLKLDWNKMSEEVKNGKFTNLINYDVAYGDKIGIQATPTFYLDGVKLNLAVPADLTSAVDNVMK
jgi:protein-disulfide isomerase